MMRSTLVVLLMIACLAMTATGKNLLKQSKIISTEKMLKIRGGASIGPITPENVMKAYDISVVGYALCAAAVPKIFSQYIMNGNASPSAETALAIRWMGIALGSLAYEHYKEGFGSLSNGRTRALCSVASTLYGLYAIKSGEWKYEGAKLGKFSVANMLLIGGLMAYAFLV